MVITVNNETSETWHYESSDFKHGKWSSNNPQKSFEPGTSKISSQKGTGTSYGTEGSVVYKNGTSQLTIKWSKPYGHGTSTCTPKLSEGSPYTASMSDMDAQPTLSQCKVTISSI